MALIEGFDTFLLDLDGCVYVGGQPIPGSADAVRAMLSRGKNVRFLTNDPHGDLSFFLDRLHRLGIPGKEDEIIGAASTAGVVLA